MADDRGKTIQSVDRGIEILRSVAEDGRCGYADLLEKSALSRSSIHHYVSSLEAAGLVRTSESDILPGAGLVALAGEHRRRLPWFRPVRNEADDLAHDAEVTVSIEIPHREDMLVVYATRRTVPGSVPYMGYREPRERSASGIACGSAKPESSDTEPEHYESHGGGVLARREHEGEPEANSEGEPTEIVRLSRALPMEERHSAVLSCWTLAEDWDQRQQRIVDSVGNAIGRIEVSTTYAAWTSDY
jgi:DNA-binding IclR family transcriptional regulator